MTARNSFTPDEIALCAYAAMYDARDFGGVERIERLTHRSSASIKMKIRNIAAMLDEANIPRFSAVLGLSGRPPSESGRTTNWEQVLMLARLSKSQFLAQSGELLNKE